MEHAHTANHDHILASFLEHGSLPEIARRVNMSLASLAAWATRHADLLASLHQLITTRCKLLVAQLECAALSSLAAVSAAPTDTDDAKLRERSLERQRKAACAILRHKTCLQRTPSASSRPHAPTNPRSPAESHTSDASAIAESKLPNAAPVLDALMPHASVPASARSTSQPKPSLAERIAARRLSALATSPAFP